MRVPLRAGLSGFRLSIGRTAIGTARPTDFGAIANNYDELYRRYDSFGPVRYDIVSSVIRPATVAYTREDDGFSIQVDGHAWSSLPKRHVAYAGKNPFTYEGRTYLLRTGWLTNSARLSLDGTVLARGRTWLRTCTFGPCPPERVELVVYLATILLIRDLATWWGWWGWSSSFTALRKLVSGP